MRFERNYNKNGENKENPSGYDQCKNITIKIEDLRVWLVSGVTPWFMR
jgi:hypothetical protein